MDKYEISLWEDYPDITPNSGIPFLNERKLCVIGAHNMTSAARALEPKLVSNVNGTHTFTFRIYYRYNDEITGEENINPYLPYIINERKVKVLWKGVWYDLVIKKIEEDTQKKSVVCTCEDLFITELSKNGYELEFSSELQNNSGTAFDLMNKVLSGSGWRPALEQDEIIQYQEEPVYEVTSLVSFNAIKQSPDGDDNILIGRNKKCLLFQSSLNESSNNIQFLYTSDEYLTEENGMLVLNGDCCTFNGIVSQSGDQAAVFKFNSNGSTTKIFDFEVSKAFSSEYRAKRLVNSQETVFDDLLGRYVDVYTDQHGDEVYGYETTEYSDPTLVVNLIANSKDFKDTKGWIGEDLTWKVYPSFVGEDKNQTTSNYGEIGYAVKSYLRINGNSRIYNTGLISNKQYLTPNSADIREGKLGGFQLGEKYIFRYKMVTERDEDGIKVPNEGNYAGSGLDFNIYDLNNDPTGLSPYFTVKSAYEDNYWIEYEMECSRPCPAGNLDKVGIFIKNTASSNYWIEDIQFFKLAYGSTSCDDTGTIYRINPGEISLQSIAKVVYRYYNPNHNNVKDVKDLEFLYQGEEKSDDYTPKYNNYKKITSIEASKSNRFNILQTIAEKFECWVKFIINHNQQTGQIEYDEDGLPEKYVQLVEQIGHDTGISFEYGIDLKGIKRTIVSNTIATKAIIIPNENEFGKHGFCTITRSKLNYCRENFILNFDYYIQQGLLNKDDIEGDLYKINQRPGGGKYLGYFYYLNKKNKLYDALADEITVRQVELTKKKAEYKVQFSNLQAALEKKTSTESDLVQLAGVNNISEANEYAQNHINNRKVQSLMNTLGSLRANIRELTNSTNELNESIQNLETYINQVSAQMDWIVNDPEEGIKVLHENFFKKYSRFIQEGTWQDQNYVSDDDYYLDALEVAYRSSRPQIQYDISLLRLSGLKDFSSKIFDLGDICYIQDKEFFGYEEDKITPYKQRVIISQLTSYFDTPEKDVIKVQNYKTQFDDLFQRITTVTQALQFSQGQFERAAGVVKPDKTLSFELLQDTFDYNKDLILNSANQQVTWDNTGITVADESNSALKVKIMAGGIFASSDGGNTWKNALRGDGISTDLLTAGRINTSEIYIYDGNNTTFRWDSQGINAYTNNLLPELNKDGSFKRNSNGDIIFKDYQYSKFVRFDQFGIYGYSGREDFVPSSEEEIWSDNDGEPNPDVKFGLTWKGFFLRGNSNQAGLSITNTQDYLGNDQITFKMSSFGSTANKNHEEVESSLEISTTNDIVLRTGNVNRIQIGRYNYQREINGQLQYYPGTNQPIMDTDYGIFVRDSNGKDVFSVSVDGVDTIGGWNLTQDSFFHSANDGSTVGLYSQGKKWTIIGPKETNPFYNTSNTGDTNNSGNTSDDGEIIVEEEYDPSAQPSEPQTPSAEPQEVDGHRDTYYILAGNKFGVTIDGRVYSTGGRIGGWTIGDRTLSATSSYGTITIDSSGSITTGDIVDNTDPKNPVIIGGWTISANGKATFNDITANYGKIAGWTITEDSISNGTTTLSSATAATVAAWGNNGYDIVTSSIAAYGGSIGGCTLGPQGISGGNWSLSSTGGTIGGWNITQYGIYSQPQAGYQTLLDPNGSLQFRHSDKIAKIFEYQTGVVGIDPDLHVVGIITADETIRSNSNVTAPEFIFPAPTEGQWPITLDRTDATNIKKLNNKQENDTTDFDDTHIDYLIWLHNNWKHITPRDVGL